MYPSLSDQFSNSEERENVLSVYVGKMYFGVQLPALSKYYLFWKIYDVTVLYQTINKNWSIRMKVP